MRDKEFDGTFILLLLYEKFYFVLLSTFFSFAFLISIEEIFHRIFTLDHSLNFSFNLLQWFTCKTSGFRYVFNFRFFSLRVLFFFAISTSQDFSIRKIFKKKLLARRAATKTEVTRPVSGYWNSHTTEKYNLFFLWAKLGTLIQCGHDVLFRLLPTLNWRRVLARQTIRFLRSFFFVVPSCSLEFHFLRCSPGSERELWARESRAKRERAKGEKLKTLDDETENVKVSGKILFPRRRYFRRISSSFLSQVKCARSMCFESYLKLPSEKPSLIRLFLSFLFFFFVRNIRFMFMKFYTIIVPLEIICFASFRGDFSFLFFWESTKKNKLKA